MSSALLLKILPPNQIHQLGCSLLLLRIVPVSVKPHELDLLSVFPSSSSSFSLVLSVLSAVRHDSAVRFSPSASLSASSGLFPSAAPNDFSLFSDLSTLPSGSVLQSCVFVESDCGPAPQLCPRSRRVHH